MAEWQEPIFDRTQSDVDYAKAQLRQQINNVDLKGCLNVIDLTRMETDIQYLADKLVELYYFNVITTRDTWAMTTIPYASYLNQIINSIRTLWTKYERPPGAVDLPNTLLTFEQVNAVEKNLYLIKEMLDDMIDSFRICGTFNCGEA